MKTIGILGGMGPEATADLYMSIIRKFQKNYGAKYDRDFPPFFIFSVPIPDVVEQIEQREEIIRMLVDGVKQLESSGADFIAIACNTVQVFLPILRKSVSIPILSIPEETVKTIQNKKYTKVGLLATETTVRGKLFEELCVKQNIELIVPEDQARLTQIIMNILAGKNDESDKQQLLSIIASLQSSGAEAVILGCTDLPLILKQKDVDIELIDTTQVLASTSVFESRQKIFKQECAR